MSGVWVAPALLAGLLLTFALARQVLQQRFPLDQQSLVEAIDALLPQTQCAQCNFPGCRPYAEAIAGGSAPINLCPPGGEHTHHQLKALMGETHATVAPLKPAAATVRIDEARCIGCTLCLPPCPVDAIVGAQGLMHTVLQDHCTGCELCIPACPVDCIELLTHPEPLLVTNIPKPGNGPVRGCIQCGQCDGVCPVNLPVSDLFQQVHTGQTTQAAQSGLLNCVECGLCDRVCPSNIPLADIFGAEIQTVQADLAADAERQKFKIRHEVHQQRVQHRSAGAAEKRAARLQANRSGKRRWD